MRIKETSRLITLIILVLSVAGMVSLVYSYNLMDKQMDTDVRLRKAIEAINELTSGSDVLTAAIRNYAATGEKWQTFDELYDWLYRDYVNRFSQPLMITEFASANTGGDKTQWVDNMFRSFRKYPGIKVAIWWDGADKDAYGNIARSYYIDEPKSVLDVFRKHLRDTWKFNSLG